MTPLKILIVDDSLTFRKILTDVIGGMPGLKLAGIAVNGKQGLEKALALKPDLITLDVEMPLMNGLETLRALKQARLESAVVMLSAVTVAGAKETIEALELGALGFLTKPQANNLLETAASLTVQLTEIVTGLEFLKSRPSFAQLSLPERKETPIRNSAEAVAIGISTGGPEALARVIPALPSNLAAPVFIVQHMPPVFTRSLAESLNKKSGMTVLEGEADMPAVAGHVYIAPGGTQMKIEGSPSGGAPVIRITDDPPENNCRPSADPLFRSVAKLYGARALGVIMTGLGKDGVVGLRVMKHFGAQTLAQDAASCVVYGMPGEAVRAGVIDSVVSLNTLAEEICKRIKSEK